MTKEEKLFDKKTLVYIGIGVLLYMFLQKPPHEDTKIKQENKPVDIAGDDNKVTKGVNIEMHNPALIRIDPNVQVSHYFRNSEYFGKKKREVPAEHYTAWQRFSSKVLDVVRGAFGGPVLISRGYDFYKNGSSAVIRPQNNNHDKLWDAVMKLTETGQLSANAVTRLMNKWIEIKS